MKVRNTWQTTPCRTLSWIPRKRSRWNLACIVPPVTALALCVAHGALAVPQDAAPSSFGAPRPAGAPPEPESTPPKPGTPPADPAPPPGSGGVAHGKRTPAVLASPGRVWPNDPALLRLERERAALELVDHAASQGLQDATRRIAAMHAFIEQQGIAGDYATFMRSHVPQGDQITFEDAVSRAMDQSSVARPQPQTNDLSQLEQATEVEAGVARASFNGLNRSRRTVAMLSQFLAQQDLLAFYQAWAPGFMRSKGWAPKGPAAGQGPETDAIRRRALQLEWDRAHRQQRQLSQWQAGPPQDQGAPPAPGGVPSQVAPGPPPARGASSNSWYNSYADPYYDMSGYPGRDPDAGSPKANDPATYGWAPEAYTGNTWPSYWDLGPNVVPFGMFPGGAAGGIGFGGRGGAVGGAAGGGGAR